MERRKPDILVSYRPAEDDSGLDGEGGSAYALVYVRPETNRLTYEGEILSAVRGRAEVVYMANLNGRLFLEDGILPSHYASQFRFAADPAAFLAAYPELATAFAAHFGLPAAEADLVGSLAAVERGEWGAEELFSTAVPAADFLACHGQTFKRMGRRYVVNYDLPAIVSRYTPEADVFVILVRRREAAADFHLELNRAIYEKMLARPETPLLAGDRLAGLAWPERVRRTYHVSANRLMALLDMADFVYADASRRLSPAETPLGAALVAGGAVDAAGLAALARRQLCRMAPSDDGEPSLLYLPRPSQPLGEGAVAALLGRCAAFA